jgi:peroxiredoxin
MSTKTTARSRTGGRPTGSPAGRSQRRAVSRARTAVTHQPRRATWAVWGVGLAVIVGIIIAMMLTSRATQSATVRPAPDFTLTDTNGTSVHLADYRGRTVVLYFNEGAGCQACIYQMAEIERTPEFAASGITVLPIVMNTAEQIRADMAAEGVQTPFLIDADGSVSRAYGTLGKGMHAGLPGHSFVLIDANGMQRWYGEYPSMYLSATDLLTQVRDHLE